VEVFGRGGSHPVFTSRFLQVRQAAPDPAVLAPTIPADAELAATTTADLAEALASVLTGTLPDTLAGRERTLPAAIVEVTGGGVYGTGLSTMVALVLPGRLSGQTADAARDAGGLPVPMAGAEAYELRASLLTAVVVHADHSLLPDREAIHAWLLVGFVDPQLLRRAASELIGRL
jgi:hypothetical protein